MGRKYFSIKTLPEPWDIVWCRFPQKEDPNAPGPVARPCLVWQTRILEDEEGIQYGAVTVSYGGDAKNEQPGPNSKDLIVADWPTVKGLGLHKPTRFSLNPNDRPEFIWGPEYFLPPDYLRGVKVVIGRLTQLLIDRLKACLRVRGL